MEVAENDFRLKKHRNSSEKIGNLLFFCIFVPSNLQEK